MTLFQNPHRGSGLAAATVSDAPYPLDDAAAARALVDRCPHYAETPLVLATDLAAELGLGALYLKDERARMGLGSFKALGAAHMIARHAAWGTARGRTYITASAGNHGLSVAAGAAAFGAQSIIVLAETVPEGFADRLRALGAQVRRSGAVYEDSMAAAEQIAAEEGAYLLSDSSWPGYMEAALGVMEGYLILADEAVDQMGQPPTHVMLQAGVGGMAAAVAALVRARWGQGPIITVVEPQAAPAILESLRAGQCIETTGPVSEMGRLDCKTPSLIALRGLARDADFAALISEQACADAIAQMAAAGYGTSPSGGAGVAALFDADLRAGIGAGPDARVLCILSEGPA